MNRETELQHLADADRHIEEARARIARLQASVASVVPAGEGDGPTTLGTLRDVFSTFLTERASIARTIADIDAGKYRYL